MNYEYINKIIEDIYTEFGDKYGNELNKLLVKEQKEKEMLDKIKDVILYKYPVLNSDMDDLKQELLEILEEKKDE